MRDGLERVEGIVHAFHAALFDRLLRIGNCRLDFAGHGADLFAVLIQRLLHLVDEAVETIARFDLFTLVGIFGRV